MLASLDVRVRFGSGVDVVSDASITDKPVFATAAPQLPGCESTVSEIFLLHSVLFSSQLYPSATTKMDQFIHCYQMKVISKSHILPLSNKCDNWIDAKPRNIAVSCFHLYFFGGGGGGGSNEVVYLSIEV